MQLQRQWVLYAVLALLSYASCNFLIGVIGKEAKDPSAAGISATFVLWLVSGGCGLIAMLIQALTKGFLAGLGGKVNALLATVAGLVMAVAMLILTLGIAADAESAGPITAMLPLASIFVSFLAFAILGERLKLQQILGIVIAVAGPVCMASADTSSSALKGLILGFGAALAIGLNNFLLKLVGKRGADDISVVIVMFITHALAGVGSVGGQYASGEGLQSLDSPKLVACAFASGIFFFMASVFIMLALKGLAGPASATANASSVGVLILDAIFYSPPMQALKLVGMGLTILGVTLLALTPQPKRDTLDPSVDVAAAGAVEAVDLEKNPPAPATAEAQPAEAKVHADDEIDVAI